MFERLRSSCSALQPPCRSTMWRACSLLMTRQYIAISAVLAVLHLALDTSRTIYGSLYQGRLSCAPVYRPRRARIARFCVGDCTPVVLEQHGASLRSPDNRTIDPSIQALSNAAGSTALRSLQVVVQHRRLSIHSTQPGPRVTQVRESPVYPPRSLSNSRVCMEGR